MKALEVLFDSKTAEVEKLEEEIKKIDSILSNYKLVTEGLERNTNRIKKLEALINKSKDSGFEIDETKLKRYKAKKKELEITYNTLSNTKKHLVLLRSLCGDDGIKTFIIKKYLPTINKLLNTYLNKFQTDIVFNFDVEFNEEKFEFLIIKTMI